MITWIPYTGYGTVEQREKPPRNESFAEREWTQIGMFRPIRMDHTNCLQVAIKTLQF
jgi:hypothetical protein